MAATIKSLLVRGNYVAVEAGRLVITPISGRPVPDDWYKENLRALIADIAATTGNDIFQYQRFVVNKFGAQGRAGVMLDYVNIRTGESAQVFYNAELTRERTTKAGKKGDPLPKNQFRVSERGRFVDLWRRLGLKLPNRLSMFHRYMGNLKPVFVVSDVDRHRLIKPTIQSFSIDVNELKRAFGILGDVDRAQTICRQGVDKMQTRSVDKETQQAQAPQGFQTNSGTSKKSTYLSNQVGAHKAMPLDSLSKELSNPIDQDMNGLAAKPNAIPAHILRWEAEMERNHQTRLAANKTLT